MEFYIIFYIAYSLRKYLPEISVIRDRKKI